MMKNKYVLLVVFGLVVTLLACKKTANTADYNYRVVGKWQETKVRIYARDASGAILTDTTYSGQTFTSLDFAQFNSDGTVFTSSDYLYFPAGPSEPKSPEKYLSTGTQNYTATGSGTYAIWIAQTVVNPGGFATADTAKVINANNLLIHFINYGHSYNGPSTVYDSYFTRM